MVGRSVHEIGLYAVAIFLVRASSFATVPILIALLAPGEFSVWAKIEPLVLLVIPLAGMGINIGYMRVHSTDGNMQARLFPFHFCFTVLAAIACSILMRLFGMNWDVVLLIAAIVIAEGCLIFLITYWRASNEPLAYATVEGGRASAILLFLIVSVFFTLAFPSTAEGYLSIRAVIAMVFVVLGYLTLRWRPAPDWTEAKKAIQYGLPIALSSVAVVALMNFDRYGVSVVAGDSYLPQYVAHVKVGQILGAALAPFFVWFAPIAIQKLNSGKSDERAFFRDSFYWFFSANLTLSLGLWLITPILWPILFSSLPFDSTLFAINVVAMSLFVCGNPLSIGTLIDGRTHRALLFVLLATFVGLAVAIALAPESGAIGIALGKAVGLATYTFLFAVDTVLRVRVRYHWGPMSLLLLLTLCIGGGISYVQPLLSLAMEVTLTFAAPIMLLVISSAFYKFKLKV